MCIMLSFHTHAQFKFKSKGSGNTMRSLLPPNKGPETVEQ